MNCNFFFFYSYFKIFLINYDNDGNCTLDKMKKRLYSFLCTLFKMVTFLDLEKATNEKNSNFIEKTSIHHKTP